MSLNYGNAPTGEFQEKDFGHWFTYKNTSDPWALANGLPHEIDVGDTTPRFGRVLSTVAYVATDEDEYGKAVCEKWNLKKHNRFSA